MGAGRSSQNKEEIKNWVNEQINSNLVIVFSKTYCPYCRKAKNALSAAELQSYTVHELNKRKDGEIIMDVLGDLTGERTVSSLNNILSNCSNIMSVWQLETSTDRLKSIVYELRFRSKAAIFCFQQKCV